MAEDHGDDEIAAQCSSPNNASQAVAPTPSPNAKQRQQPPGEIVVSSPSPKSSNSTGTGNTTPKVSFSNVDSSERDEAVRRLEAEVRTFTMLNSPEKNNQVHYSIGGGGSHLRYSVDPPSQSQTSSISENTGPLTITSEAKSPSRSPSKANNTTGSARVIFQEPLEDIDDSSEFMNTLGTQTAGDDDARSVVSRVSQVAGSVTRVAGAFAAFVSTGTTMIEEDEEEEEHCPSKQDSISSSIISKSPTEGTHIAGDGSLYPSPSNSTEQTPIAPETNEVRTNGVPVEPELDDLIFLQDDVKDMTFGRRIARKFHSSTWYYNPEAVRLAQESQKKAFRSEREEELIQQAKVEEGDADGVVNESDPQFDAAYRAPNLDMGWAHFEHVTLPRYVVPSLKNTQMASITIPESNPTSFFGKLKHCVVGSNEYDNLKAAEPGESSLETKLYSVYHTPLSQLGDFGLGIGLYFSTLQSLAILTFFAGLISIPNLSYYKSTAYSKFGQEGLISMPSLGSAICTAQNFVLCEDCSFDQFRVGVDDSRLAISHKGSTSTSFALKNNCLGAEMPQGMVNFASLLFVFVGIMLMSIYQQRKAVEFDEDEQTAQDYSILVGNPPKDAYDPEEWRKYFADQFSTQVTVCTVVVENDLLLQALAERRDRLRQLELLLPVGESMELNHIARLAAEFSYNRKGVANLLRVLHPFGLALDIPALYERIVVLTERARGLAQRQCPVSKVFITFETEEDQRIVLSALSYGSFTSISQDTSKVNADYLFRGSRVLSINEPSEPSAVRWQNLDDNMKRQIVSLCITTFVCLAAIVLIAFIVAICRDRSAQFAAVAIAVFNALFPMFAQAMTALESHAEEGLKERSLYIKIAAFRWINTAVVINVVTPFTSTLTAGGEHLIYSVYAIFFAEIVTVNALQVLDIGGQFQRHFLAPRAPDQERMNLNFRGTQFFLAERYTTLTKVLFLNFYYSAVFPGTFFFSSAAFALNYVVDKFSLMRTWAPAPKLGKQVADFSRKYFFSAAIVAFAFTSSYTFSGFPYDNICDTGKVAESTTQYVATIGENGEDTSVTISEGDKIYKYCNQNYLSSNYPITAFPALPVFQVQGSEWMTPSQERVITIYGWASIAFICLFLVVFSVRLTRSMIHFFTGHYSAKGSDMNINFSDVEVIDSYIPQVKNENHSYPFIACNIDNIPTDLMSWRDPTKPYDYYNLYKDATKLFDGTMYDVHPNAFSKIVHWNADHEDEAEISRPYEKNLFF